MKSGAVRLKETEASPRASVIGLWDHIVGPGATRSENALILLWATFCTAGVLAYALFADLGWSVLQLVVIAFVAFDVGGGVPANASNSAKHWYHRPGQGFREHFAFPLVHVHPFVLAFLFPGFGWGVAAMVYAYLLAAAAVILGVPLYLKRPVAFVLYSVVLLAALYALGVPPGLEWFVPMFFLKLLVAHLLPEKAYRPHKEEV